MWSWLAGTCAMRCANASAKVVELGLGHGLRREAPLDGGAPVDGVAGQQQPLRALEPDAVHPHRGRGRAPHPRRRVADAAVLGADDQVGAQREVGAAADAEAVHLRDHRLGRAPQRHVGGDVARHQLVVDDRVPGARLLPHHLRAPVDVVAGAEAPAPRSRITRTWPSASARCIAASNASLRHDRVQPVGPVERQRRDGHRSRRGRGRPSGPFQGRSRPRIAARSGLAPWRLEPCGSTAGRCGTS